LPARTLSTCARVCFTKSAPICWVNLSTTGWPRFTPESVTDRRSFLRQVRLAQAQGWWSTAGQLDTGLTGVSVPLKDRRGRCIAAVGMTVQTVHWNKERVVAQLLPVLQTVAQDLRQIL
jgi:IclR family transcriptional regulator, pca regulon regulatory protein